MQKQPSYYLTCSHSYQVSENHLNLKKKFQRELWLCLFSPKQPFNTLLVKRSTYKI